MCPEGKTTGGGDGVYPGLVRSHAGVDIRIESWGAEIAQGAIDEEQQARRTDEEADEGAVKESTEPHGVEQTQYRPQHAQDTLAILLQPYPLATQNWQRPIGGSIVEADGEQVLVPASHRPSTRRPVHVPRVVWRRLHSIQNDEIFEAGVDTAHLVQVRLECVVGKQRPVRLRHPQQSSPRRQAKGDPEQVIVGDDENVDTSLSRLLSDVAQGFVPRAVRRVNVDRGA